MAVATKPDAAPVKTQEEQYAEMVAGLRANRPEYVTIELPLPNDNEDVSIFASVNGRRVLVPRGKPVTVPIEIADVIRDSQKADMQARMKRDALLQATAEAERNPQRW